MSLLGTSFSHRHAHYLGLAPEQALLTLIEQKFSLIRLGCYWDEIEKKPGVYDFSMIKKLLILCDQRKQDVIVTVGMKAPRWPEYYFPSWIEKKDPSSAKDSVLAFIKETVSALKTHTSISYWQVENEPLDPSGPEELSIPLELLKKETAEVRKTDSRPVIITLWGNELTKRKLFPFVVPLADIIGLDIYYKVPFLARFYRGPHDDDKKIQEFILHSPKPIWITELQAEPWEHNSIVATGKTPSMNEELLRKNFERVSAWNVEAVLLWGSEYWLAEQKKRNAGLFAAVSELVRVDV